MRLVWLRAAEDGHEGFAAAERLSNFFLLTRVSRFIRLELYLDRGLVPFSLQPVQTQNSSIWVGC